MALRNVIKIFKKLIRREIQSVPQNRDLASNSERASNRRNTRIGWWGKEWFWDV